MTTRLILVGGFLGAGKTTLLWQAAQALSRRGLRVGLITNDQAPELVDTAFLSRGESVVAEVNGSCFCCNFQGFLGAASRLAAQADVIIAEPVGSCTDLSATILQPLKERHGREFAVAPLSVMADPVRLTEILDDKAAGLHPSAAYIFRKQLEEADLIVISKADLLAPVELEMLKARVTSAFAGASVCAMSAKTGAGVEMWLDAVTSGTDAGRRIVAVDYDVYAEGEAVLGWLNGTVMLHGSPAAWATLAARLLGGLSRSFDQNGVAVGHVKMILEGGDCYLVGNLTGTGETISVRGEAPTGSQARLVLNARVQMPPETLNAVAQQILAATTAELGLAVTPVAWRCLSPGRPNPTHRYDRVVAPSPRSA